MHSKKYSMKYARHAYRFIFAGIVSFYFPSFKKQLVWALVDLKRIVEQTSVTLLSRVARVFPFNVI